MSRCEDVAPVNNTSYSFQVHCGARVGFGGEHETTQMSKNHGCQKERQKEIQKEIRKEIQKEIHTKVKHRTTAVPLMEKAASARTRSLMPFTSTLWHVTASLCSVGGGQVRGRRRSSREEKFEGSSRLVYSTM